VTGLGGAISIINSATNKVVGTIRLGDNLQQAALNPATGLLYAANSSGPGDPGTIFVVNVVTRRILARIIPGGSSRPYAIGVNSATDTIYVVDNPNPGGQGVFVINGSTNQIITRIPTPLYPGAIAINPKTDQAYVLTGTAEDNAVMEFDGHDNQFVSTVSIGTFDATFDAVNPAANDIYVTARSGEFLVLAGW